MKKILPALFLFFTFLSSAQSKFEEKIGTGYSFLYPVHDYYNNSFQSKGNLSLAISAMDKDKKLTLKKELEAELFLIKGSMYSGGLGAGSYINNIKGYNINAKLKMMPLFKMKMNDYLSLGPVIGCNLTAHWKYSETYWNEFSGSSGERTVSESANDYFNRLFYGGEINFSHYYNSKKEKNYGVEFSTYYYFRFFKIDQGMKDYFSRFGFRLSILHPTGFLKRKTD